MVKAKTRNYIKDKPEEDTVMYHQPRKLRGEIFFTT